MIYFYNIPYGVYYKLAKLSVFGLVPTLTSELRRDLSLDGWCKCECRDTGFILVPATGLYVQQSVRVHCIALHQGARREGYKQGGRGDEASKSLNVRLIETKCQYIGESTGVVAWTTVVTVRLSSL